MKARKTRKTSARLGQAKALFDAGRWREAAAALNSILGKSPDHPEALELMAELAFKQGDAGRAMQMLERVARVQPDSFSVHNKLAVAYAVQARFPEAAGHLRRAIGIKPDHLPAYLDLCKVTREMGLLDQSIDAGTRAVSLAADDPRAHSSLALSCERFGQHARAHSHYQRAAELAPDDAARQFACGVSYMGAGDKAAAREKFEQVLQRQPEHAQALWMLARLNRYDDCGHADFQRIGTLLANPALDEEQRSHLHFALGKMYDDCGNYDVAFEHFAAGNRIENARYHYDPEEYRDYIDSLIETFSAAFFADLPAGGNRSEQPVFIVGMPRSGTTLVEQILASHSQVFGAGELSWFTKTEHDLCAFIGSGALYPRCVKDIKAEHIDALGKKYLAYLAVLSGQSGCRHITDKMPSNYERIGLISLLFPNARIIHCRRDPLDNAVSQFSLLFQGNMEYSRDLYNLGRHYADYARLMEHWKQCRPDNLHEIRYETLVENHRGEIQRLLEFVGLPWEDSCLNFFAAKRAVRTSSDFQVRQPIYSTSVARWKHYDKHLEPLRRGLRAGGDDANTP